MIFACLPAVFVFLILSGCGGGGGGSSGGSPVFSIADSTPPGQVAGLAAGVDDGSISLSWSNPSDSDFAGVVVRRSTAAYPSGPTAGDATLAYPCGPCAATQSFTDPDLANNSTYYYSVFTHDRDGNYSQAATISTTAVYDPFSIIVIPDTQYYINIDNAVMNTLITWIIDNVETENIKFVLHEGDITNDNTTEQWDKAETEITRLDGVVPYVLAVGNHDDGPGRDTTGYNAAFPVSRYEDLDWFGGVFETGKMDNSYHYFSAGGTDWLVVSLEYNPRDEALAWACGVVEDNPGRRVMFVTHAYLAPDGERSGIGEDIWNKFVKLYGNMLFVFNGHYTDDTSARLTSVGDNGNTVYQMFADYQDEMLGGLGKVRIVTLDPAGMDVSVRTFATAYPEYDTDDADQFEYENVAFGPPE